MIIITDSVSPTVVTASTPTRLTQKTSTTAKSASMLISKTIGTASMNKARLRFPVVKSFWSPFTAALRIFQMLSSGNWMASESIIHFLIEAAKHMWGAEWFPILIHNYGGASANGETIHRAAKPEPKWATANGRESTRIFQKTMKFFL